jgi:hypothetical protein
MTGESFFEDRRAVRDIIGFVLTFSIVVTAVGLTSTTGFNQLREVRDQSQTENAQNAMRLIEGNIDGLANSKTAKQTSDVGLNGGTLVADPQSAQHISVEVFDSSNTRLCCNGGSPVETGTFEYRLDEVVFTYESGTLFRTQERGEPFRLTSPSMVCRETESGQNVAIVTVIRIQTPGGPGGVEALSGETTVEVTETVVSQSVLFPTSGTGTNADSVEVTINSPRTDAWGSYFEETGQWQGSGPSYSCENVDTAYVRQTVVQLSLSS